MTVLDTWIGRRPQRGARLRLFCLPCAGGGASMYHAWRDHVPAGIDFCPIQLPGRETRLHEAPFTALSPLVASLADAIAPHAATPYAVFGHSMGAVVGFELARELRRRAVPGPQRLIVAGCKAPDAPRLGQRHRLSDTGLIEELRRFGGTPRRLLEDAELMRHVLPALRADFAVLETSRVHDEPPLALPIAGFAGADDEEAPPREMAAWERHTSAGFRLTVLPGNHFFVQAHGVRRALVEAVTRDLSGAAPAARLDSVRVSPTSFGTPLSGTGRA